MPGGELPLGNQQLYCRRQFEKSECVGHCASLFAEPLGQFFLGQAQDNEKSLVGLGFFDGVEILTLDVFREREFKQPVVRNIPDHDRDLHQARSLGRHQPAFACHELVSAIRRAHQNRLEHAVGPDRGRQLLETMLICLQARLVGVWRDAIDIDLSG